MQKATVIPSTELMLILCPGLTLSLQRTTLLTSFDSSSELRGTFPHSSSSGTSLSSSSLKMQLVSTMALSNCSSSSGGPAAVGTNRPLSVDITPVKRSLSEHDSYLTLVCSVSSQKAPEGLSVRALWVHALLNSLHMAGLAAHVLLCLDVGGQI